MGIYLPYIVLAGIVLIFFILCWILFGGSNDKKSSKHQNQDIKVPAKKTVTPQPVKKVAAKKHRVKPLPKTSATVVKEKTPVVTLQAADILAEVEHSRQEKMDAATPENLYHEDVKEGITKKAEVPVKEIQSVEEDSLDKTQVIKKVEEHTFVDNHEDSIDDATQMIPIVNEDSIKDSTPQGMERPSQSLQDATRVINSEEIQAALKDAENHDGNILKEKSAGVAVGAVSTLAMASQAKSLETTSDELTSTTNMAVKRATSHFMQTFGILGETSRQQVETITEEALNRLAITKSQEIENLLENIVVQEALFCMQKAYVSTPTKWMYETALTAFLDVVQQPKSSTPYLVAFDALRILPHLTLGHFQIMALVLLLQYSRNSNNYSLEHFKHYVEKYLEPFLSDLPLDESMYRQLDYLRCCVQTENANTFAQVLSASYPFVFNYRGFTMDELTRAMGGERLGPQFLVNSLNSSMKKLAVVDESMATRLFRMAKINDGETRRRLLALMTSKPTSFTGSESLQIMDKISPVLADFNDVFNKTSLSSTSLTLLGLYLARAHVKVTIGEEFDLSRWF